MSMDMGNLKNKIYTFMLEECSDICIVMYFELVQLGDVSL
jgi:hypothetical protein